LSEQDFQNSKDCEECDVQTEGLDISALSDSSSERNEKHDVEGEVDQSEKIGATSSDNFFDVESFSSEKVENGARRRVKIDKIITILLIIAVCVFVFVTICKLFFVGQIQVAGSSMMPNISNGSVVWVNKISQPERGDVVVFYTHDINKLQTEIFGGNGQKGGSAEKYIKRVVALAGEKIWAEEQDGDYVLFIKTADGEVRSETYFAQYYIAENGQTAQFYKTSGKESGSVRETGDVPYLGSDKLGVLQDTSAENPYSVPEDCMFVLGDNRFDSSDSRVIGAVPLSRLYGVVIL